MSPAVSAGLLVLRIVAGLTIAGHGAQKAFGWFGGAGYTKMSAGFQRQGLKPGWLWAAIAILGELGGGLSLAFGFLIQVGAAGVVGAMLMAIFRAHWRNGFWNANKGFEFPLQILASAVALGIAGAGGYSLDALLSIHLPIWVFPMLALAAIITDVVGLTISPPATPTPAPAPTAPAPAAPTR
jgi:putative oxidoreductase